MVAAPNHPNIAATYVLEKTAALAALVMEFVEGEDPRACPRRRWIAIREDVYRLV